MLSILRLLGSSHFSRWHRAAELPRVSIITRRVVDELPKLSRPTLRCFTGICAGFARGWQSRDTSKAFGDYAAYVSKHLSDRVTHFFTTNELVCFTDLGYKNGQFAPGLKFADGEVNQNPRHRRAGATGWQYKPPGRMPRAGRKSGLAENATYTCGD